MGSNTYQRRNDGEKRGGKGAREEKECGRVKENRGRERERESESESESESERERGKQKDWAAQWTNNISPFSPQ